MGLLSCSLQVGHLAVPSLSHAQPPTIIQLPTDFKKLTTLVHALREAFGKDASPKGRQR
jgi:hypothetical protein